MRKRRSLRWQLYVSYLIAILFSVGTLGWYASVTLKKQAIQDATENLQSQATLVSEIVRNKLGHGIDGSIKQCCLSMGPSLKSRITVISADGRVVADSDEDASRMDDHSLRPEIRQALAGSVGISERYSDTLNAAMVYVAVPVKEGDRIAGIVRVSRPVGRVLGSLEDIYFSLLLTAMVVVLVAAVPTLYFSYRIGKLIQTLKEAATKFVHGDLDHQLEIPPWEELAGLADAMNGMATQMSERIEALNRRRQELEAILSSMVEAVLMVDNKERLISMNGAAVRLFKPRSTQYAGRNFMEVIRNSDLQEFVKKALRSEAPIEEDIVIIGQYDIFLQAHGTTLRHADGDRIGTLVVLNDVTRLKNLEQVRKDLVTNASHELRTPVTSIKGFLETLRDGAINEPETARRFLEIMIRQSNRLASIIEDMLTLSKIEKSSEDGSIKLERVQLSMVLTTVHNEFLQMAHDKQIDLQLQCDPSLVAMINGELFQQAISNLVDNAIKYTEAGGKVVILSRWEKSLIVVCVEDQGIGIPREHLSRIFERFYRVDAGRSRKMGGTGLGLAIVKHIVAAHGGKITVESSPGAGSKFCIYLAPLGRASGNEQAVV